MTHPSGTLGFIGGLFLRFRPPSIGTRNTRVVVVAASLGLTGCPATPSEDSRIGADAGNASLDDAAESSSVQIGPNGGTASACGGVLTIPAGALASETTVTTSCDPHGTVRGYSLRSALYRFAPEGLVFAAAASLSVPFETAAAPVAVYWSRTTGGGYDELPTHVVGGNAVAAITHFSSGFAAQAPDDASADAPGDVAATGPGDGAASDSTSVDAASIDSGSTEAGTSDATLDDAGAQEAGAAEASSDGNPGGVLALSDASAWTALFGMTGNRQAVATDHNGNVVIAGTTPDSQILFAKYDQHGNRLWNKSFAGSFGGSGVAIDSADNIVLVGVGSGSNFSVGGAVLGQGSFAAKFAPDGSHIWSESLVSGTWDDAPRVVLDAAGEVIAIGRLFGTATIAGGPSRTATTSVYAVKLGADGSFVWSVVLGVGDDVRSATPDGTGGAAFVGPNSSGNAASYVAHIDGTGALLAGHSIGDSTTAAIGVAMDPSGNTFVSMQMDPTSAGCPGDFAFTLTKYDPSLNSVWTKCVQGGIYSGEQGTGLLADDGGAVTIVGSVSGAPDASVDLGGGPITVVGPFAARYGPDGGYIQGHVWPISTNVLPIEVSAGPARDLYLLGIYGGGTLDFGQGPNAVDGGNGFLTRQAL